MDLKTEEVTERPQDSVSTAVTGAAAATATAIEAVSARVEALIAMERTATVEGMPASSAWG
jgi:hypothetical protein